MTPQELKAALNLAKIDTEYVESAPSSRALLTLAKALACEECWGTGHELAGESWSDDPCPSCSEVRKVVREFYEGRKG